jgi:hypothetical protein
MAVLDFQTRDLGTLVSLNAVGTATNNGGDIYNQTAKGVKVTVNVGVITAGNLTVTIQGKDSVSGLYYTILASASITTVSTVVLTVFPGATNAANVFANDQLPAIWRVSCASNTGPVTATVAAVALL